MSSTELRKLKEGRVGGVWEGGKGRLVWSLRRDRQAAAPGAQGAVFVQRKAALLTAEYPMSDLPKLTAAPVYLTCKS